MATCRLQVIRDERFKELSIFQWCECNLNSNELILSAEEKSMFLNAYCIEHFSDVRNELKTCEFFPLLCSLYQKNKNTDFLKFFSNPFQFYDKELKHLLLQDDTGKYKYCCLFLLVIFNNNLKEEFLSGKIDCKVKKIIKDTLPECELNKGTSPKCLLKSLKTLEGSFLICKDGCYRTIHDKLFDYLAFYFGNKMIHILIDHADSKFIRERLLWETNQTKDTDFTVYIPNKFVDAYIERVIQDWSDGKVWCVFFNRNMKSHKFTSKLLGHLNQLDPSYQLQLAQKNVNNKFNDTTSLLSCFVSDVNLTLWIINNGGNVNQCRNNGVSPLYISCQEGHIDTVRELIKCGADINKCEITGKTPLYQSSYKGNLHIVKELLQCGAEKNKSNNLGASPLQASCWAGHIDTVRELIKCGADINKCTITGDSPLLVSSYKGLTDIVRELIKGKADLNKCNDKGASPLYASCIEGFIDTARELLKYGADVNKCDITGMTPLNLSSHKGHLLIVKDLIHCGADINKSTDEGVSPLFASCLNGHMDIARELIKCGADINKCKVTGESPLFVSSYKGLTDIVRELIMCEADINKCHDTGTSSLYIACEIGNIDIVRELVQAEADTNKCQHVGESPLFAATTLNRKEIVTVLLQNNSDVNKCANNKVKYCEAIVKYHKMAVDTYMEGVRDNIIFKYASPQVKHYIQESLGNLVLDLIVGSSPLHMACFMGHVDIVKLILENNPNINITKEDGTTPLFLACEFGHGVIVKLMIENGADDKICRNDGKSPYCIALENGHSDVITLLSRHDNKSV